VNGDFGVAWLKNITLAELSYCQYEQIANALAAYLAKYLSKSQRTTEDKGARLVSYSSKVLRVCTQSFHGLRVGNHGVKRVLCFLRCTKCHKIDIGLINTVMK
jgi:hypothetical protein